MKNLRTWVGVLGGVALMASGAAMAESKDAKMCGHLTEFRNAVTELEGLGPESTVNDMRTAEMRVEKAGKAVVKESKHDKHAKDLEAALKDLKHSIDTLPGNATLASARSTIMDEVGAVRTAGQQYHEQYCASEPMPKP